MSKGAQHAGIRPDESKHHTPLSEIESDRKVRRSKGVNAKVKKIHHFFFIKQSLSWNVKSKGRKAAYPCHVLGVAVLMAACFMHGTRLECCGRV